MRTVATLLLTALPLYGGQVDGYQERISVDRVVIDAHIVDRFARPIEGLGARDFQVSVDGHPVPLESVEWVGSDSAPSREDVGTAVGTTPGPPGRSIVILFQWEISGEKQDGFVRMQRQAIEFVRGLGRTDRVAVLLFDSRLHVRQDFTGDKALLTFALRNILGHDERRGSSSESTIALTGRLSEEQERAATSIEKGILALARALDPIPGEKSLLFFGWGIGRWTPMFSNQLLEFVRPAGSYSAAQQALERARTTVFCLDISEGAHSLAAGLKRLAVDSGGFYVATYDFPRFAMRAIERTLSGHYVLVFRKPPGAAGRHRVDVRIVSRPAKVLARRFFDDGPSADVR